MRVTAIDVSETHEHTQISAAVDGFRLFYRFPAGCAVSPRGDGFMAAALIPAMAKGETLQIDPVAPVSPRMLAGVDRIQDVLRLWNPALRKIAIEAEVAPATVHDSSVASFFSGGVDSSYTYLNHASEITDMILIHGLDIAGDNERLFAQVSAPIVKTALAFGKRCVIVRCNGLDFSARMGLTMSLFHGALLASIALFRGASKTYIPSTFRYDALHPWGSHILLDERWSTETCEIVHDGAEASRMEKVKRIVDCPALMNALRVCNSDSHSAAYNCGQCEKCFRTMITLHILGAQSPTLPPLQSVSAIKKLSVNNEGEVQFFLGNYALAVEKGNLEVARALRTCIRRYELRRLAKELDAVLLGASIRSAYRRIRPGSPRPAVVGVVPWATIGTRNRIEH